MNEIFISIIVITGIILRLTTFKNEQNFWPWRWVMLPFCIGLPLARLLISPDPLQDLLWGYGIGVFICLLLDYFEGWSFSATPNGDRHRRGARMGTSEEISRILRKNEILFDISIGQAPFPKRLETFHLLLAGTTGGGKSSALFGCLDTVRQRDDRAIVADSGGQALTRYFDPRHDHLLNPFDQRGVAWSPFAEMEGPWDADSLAKSLIPDREGSSGEWNHYAQSFLSAILRRCHEQGQATNGQLLYYACVAPTAVLEPLLAGLPAATLLAEENERMLGNVRSIVGSYLTGFSYLPATAGAEAFSIRRWLNSGQRGWLFLPYKDNQLDTLKNLISCWLDIACRSVLSLDENPQRRIWLSIDEAASLGRIQTLGDFLTKARKYGGSAIVGLQSISQLRSLYGNEHAQTLLSCLSTWLVLRAGDPETAEYMSRFLGDQELLRRVASGSKTQQGESRSWADQVTSQRLVTPSEIQSLSDLHGYLRLAGKFPVCPVVLTRPRASTSKHPAFAPLPPQTFARATPPALTNPPQPTGSPPIIEVDL